MTSNPSYGDIQTYATASANTYGIDPQLFMGLIKTESGFRQFDTNGDPLRSSAGAIGLTQLLPGTGAQYGATDPYNWQSNIDAGAKYLSSLISQFGNVNSALEAYNIGPGNLRKGKFLQSGQTYADTVMNNASSIGDVSTPTGTAMGANDATSSNWRPQWLQSLEGGITGAVAGSLQGTITRVAIGSLALIILAIAILKLSGGNASDVVKTAALA